MRRKKVDVVMKLVGILVIVIVIVGGGYFFLTQNQPQPTVQKQTGGVTQEVVEDDGVVEIVVK